MKFSYYLTILFITWGVVNCLVSSPTPVKPVVPQKDISLNRKPSLKLYASEKMRNYFPILSKDYEGQEVFEGLSSIREIGDLTCEMIYSMRKYDKDEIKKFTNIELGSPITSKFYLHTFRRMIAGCWNFYQMNDISPDKDFEYLKKQYPNQKFNCYSVGFLQPYIMHSILDCDTLTLLDIDIRIIEAHAQLVKFFHEGKMATPEEVKKNLESLKISWIAQYRNFQAQTPVNIRVLCPRNMEMCLEKLVIFQEKYNHLKELNLYASAIHEANLIPKKDHISVVFVSNAFEDYYTRRKEFDYLMKNLEQNLEVGQKVIFIYHNGGRHLFGVYEVMKKLDEDESLEVTVLCRDKYLFYPEEEDRTYYNIHFDRLRGLKTTEKYCSSQQAISQITKKTENSDNQQ